MAGDSCGMMTLKKACRGVQPRSIAALYRLGSSWRSLGPTLKMTYGILKVIDAIKDLSEFYDFFICGDGDARNMVIELTNKYSNVHYLGMLQIPCIVVKLWRVCREEKDQKNVNIVVSSKSDSILR